MDIRICYVKEAKEYWNVAWLAGLLAGILAIGIHSIEF